MFLGKLKLKNRPFFKSLNQFDFGIKGLTVVHGLNLNSGNSGNTNAAGKSLLFSNLQDLFYREVLVGSRRDRVTQGLISVEFGKTKEDLHVLTSRQAGAGSAKLSISKDGVSLGFREQAKIDEFVKAVIPPSLEAYATLCHIDNRVPHPLIRGDTAVRRDFFTKFFELDSTDSLKKLISVNLSDIKSESRLLADRKSRLAAMPPRLALKALREERDAKDVIRDKLSARIESYGDKAALREFCKAHKDELTTVPDLAELKARAKALNRKLAASFVHQEYLTEKKLWESRKSARKDFIKANEIKRDEEALLEGQIEKADEHTRLLSGKRDQLDAARQLLKDLESPTLDEANCNECGAELTGALRKKHLAKHKARQEAYEDRVRLAKSKIQKLKIEIAELGDSVDVQGLKKRIKIVRATPDVPEEPDVPEGFSDNAIEDTQALTNKLKKVRDTIDEFSWANSPLFDEAGSIDIERLLAVKDPTNAYLAAMEEMATLDTRYQLALKANEERKALEEEIAATENVLLNAEALEVLEKAYGPRGIRRVLINTVCGSLEKVLNSYAKSLYPENYSFELDISSQFHILVHRKHGAESAVSDVRRLSGAESSLFSLLLWCGLMSFVPKAKRPNFLILDELDANLGQDNLERFLNFLPRVLKVVDHVIVVTPKSETRYEDVVPGVRYLTVVKRGLSSTIEAGKSSSIKA